MVPEPSAEEVIASALGETTIEVAADAVCTELPESVTVTVKLYAPLVVGVPEITPVDAAIERPLGNWPADTVQRYGAVPPVALSWPLYDWITAAPGKVADPSTNVAGFCTPAPIDKARVAVADCCGEPLSVTVTPKENVPLVVGVPEMIPVDAARDIPEGS